MQKSIEERLADIESSITRMTKMQGCMLRVLLILHKTSLLFGRSERSLTEVEQSLESTDRGMDRFLVLFFGAITMLGLATSMLSLYFATMDATARVLSIVFSILALVWFILGFLEYRRVRSQFRGAKKKLTQTEEVVESIEKEVAAANDNLAQIVAEWKELVPDDLATKSGNGTPEPKDSHDKS
jgi:hypothetical protein